jgi:hypothetical protein
MVRHASKEWGWVCWLAVWGFDVREEKGSRALVGCRWGLATLPGLDTYLRYSVLRNVPALGKVPRLSR